MIFVMLYGNFSLYLKKTSNTTVVMATVRLVSFCSPLTLIDDAKFEHHSVNISRDIIESVLAHF